MRYRADSRVFLLSVLVSGALAAAPETRDDRRPEPLPVIREEREKLIRGLYEDEYARKEPGAMLALARKLLLRASESKDDPDGRYVLLQEARDLAAKAGDPDTAVEALGRTLSLYWVDELTMKAETLAALRRSTRKPGPLRKLASLNLDLAEEAIREHSYHIAERAVSDGTAAARKIKDRWLLENAKVLKGQLAEVKRRYPELEGALVAVGESAGDPEANLAAGRFFCFLHGDWKRGLPLLEKSSNDDLRSLARRELSSPEGGMERAQLADEWWRWSEAAKGLERDILKVHAARWYLEACARLEESNRRSLHERLRKIGPQIPPYAPGMPSRALAFDGRNDYVYVDPLRYDGSHPLTVEAVVCAERISDSPKTIVGDAQDSGWALGTRKGKWGFTVRDGGAYRLAASPERAVPHRRLTLAGVYDGREARLFIDGRLQGKPVAIQRFEPSPYPLMVGADSTKAESPEHFFSGVIVEVRISRVARYSRSYRPPPLLLPDADTVLLFRFAHGEGETVDDLSGNRHEGRIWGADRVKFR